MSKLIVEAITEHYGERCQDFDAECFCCKSCAENSAWKPQPDTPDPCDELETVGEVSTLSESIRAFAGQIISDKLKPGDTLVTRQNAEKVIHNLKNEIAAKDAEIEEAEISLRSLLANYVKEHFPKNENFQPLHGLQSLVLQLDNAVTITRGFKRRAEDAEANNKRLRDALETLVDRISYYASLAEDGVPNIEDWAYTDNSGDIAKARAALGEVKP